MSLLLRRPLDTEADMQYTIAATEAGLMYIEQVSSRLIHSLMNYFCDVIYAMFS